MVKRYIAAALLLSASAASAQSVLTPEEVVLYNKTVGALSSVEDFETSCNPLNLIEKLQNHPAVLEKAGQWCETTREAVKDAAFDQALEEVQMSPNFRGGCDESDNVRLSEERAVALRELPENRHIKLFFFWKKVYKSVYMCTDKTLKAQKAAPKASVQLGELKRVP